VIHIPTVELSAQDGPSVDSAGVECLSTTRTFGKLSEAPAGMHISCKNFVSGVLSCQIGPLDSKEKGRSSDPAPLRDSKYRISIASDQADPPVVPML
jgi:hypothetical protein